MNDSQIGQYRIKLDLKMRQKVGGIQHEQLRKAVRVSYALRAAALRVLRGQRHGRVYRVPGTKKKTYTASASDEAPAVLFGSLRNSWQPTVRTEGVGSKRARFIPGIESNVRYARILDKGGFTGRGGMALIVARKYGSMIKQNAKGPVAKIMNPKSKSTD